MNVKPSIEAQPPQEGSQWLYLIMAAVCMRGAVLLQSSDDPEDLKEEMRDEICRSARLLMGEKV